VDTQIVATPAGTVGTTTSVGGIPLSEPAAGIGKSGMGLPRNHKAQAPVPGPRSPWPQHWRTAPLARAGACVRVRAYMRACACPGARSKTHANRGHASRVPCALRLRACVPACVRVRAGAGMQAPCQGSGLRACLRVHTGACARPASACVARVSLLPRARRRGVSPIVDSLVSAAETVIIVTKT
jgi:hypothetical protein